MQTRGEALVPGFLFDSDMGRNIDAALALAMLQGLGRGRVVAVAVSYSSLDAAAYCEIIGRFYGSNLPVGLAEEGPKQEDSAMLRAPLAMRNPDGQPTFRHGIRSLVDTADPPVLFRNTLLGQQQKQSIAVVAGPATNLARLLALNGARDIVASKVQLLVMAAGSFGGGTADPRIRSDIAAARKVFAEWPSPIVAVGMEAGSAAPFPDQIVESDLAPIQGHPIVPAYHAYRETQSGTGVAAPAVLAALYASNTGAEYWKLSAPGVIEVSDDGVTRFRESTTGKHRYLIADAAKKDQITRAFGALASVRPAAGRGGQRE